VVSPSPEPWYSGAAGSAFGTIAGANPEENMKVLVLGAGALAGPVGAGKEGSSGAWEELEVGAEGEQAAGPGVGKKKSRSDCSLCNETAEKQKAETSANSRGTALPPTGPFPRGVLSPPNELFNCL
jgi:hypothetical protein